MQRIWTTEAETVADILAHPDSGRLPVNYPHDKLWFGIASNWDVYANTGNYEAWWRLGNLKKISINAIFRNYEEDRPLGYRLNRPETLCELARRYGDSRSQRVVNSIEACWFDNYCEEKYREEE